MEQSCLCCSDKYRICLGRSFVEHKGSDVLMTTRPTVSFVCSAFADVSYLATLLLLSTGPLENSAFGLTSEWPDWKVSSQTGKLTLTSSRTWLPPLLFKQLVFRCNDCLVFSFFSLASKFLEAFLSNKAGSLNTPGPDMTTVHRHKTHLCANGIMTLTPTCIDIKFLIVFLKLKIDITRP